MALARRKQFVEKDCRGEFGVSPQRLTPPGPMRRPHVAQSVPRRRRQWQARTAIWSATAWALMIGSARQICAALPRRVLAGGRCIVAADHHIITAACLGGATIERHRQCHQRGDAEAGTCCTSDASMWRSFRLRHDCQCLQNWNRGHRNTAHSKRQASRYIPVIVPEVFW